MGRIVDLSSLKPRSTRRHQGLRKLSPDLIIKARDETAAQVTRIGLTFLGTAAFCLLSLLSPDSALLGGNEKIQVPGAGPVSFIGFMLLGPAVLIVLRIYLQIYVEHNDRLDRLGRSVSPVRAPTLIPLQNSLIRLFSGFIFYLLLPVAMILFAWKAAVFPAWGSGLLCVATAVVVTHVMLRFSRFSWRLKGLLSISVAIIVGGVLFVGLRLFGLELPRRTFDLERANLSGHRLLEDFRGAMLISANLSNADLHGTDLSGAILRDAKLNDADLTEANLNGANLIGVKLNGAKLNSANLSEVNLTEADLSVTQLNNANLREAWLGGANLSNADVSRANLNHSDLNGANLNGVNLIQAKLSNADLSVTHLNDADLRDAKLNGANLIYADLRDAKLNGANLIYANLSNANLSGARLSGADLSNAENLRQTQLDKACGDANTKLPEGLTLKPCSKD
jgi:uncharacterized protein YjbI with pentapeptide repeats